LQHTTAWDFLPEQPTSPLTAAALLSGGDVKGVLRERKLHYLPNARRRYIGAACWPQVITFLSLFVLRRKAFGALAMQRQPFLAHDPFIAISTPWGSP
jgi:hypothetical protein